MSGLAGLLLAIARCVQSTSAAGDGEPAPLAPEDLFARTYVRQLSLSPDGQRAVALEMEGGAALASLVVFDRGDDGNWSRTEWPLPDDTWGPLVWDAARGDSCFLRGTPPHAELWSLPCGAMPPHRDLEADVASGFFQLFWNARSEGLLALQTTDGGNASVRREAVLVRVDLDHGRVGAELCRLGTLTIKEAALSPDGTKLALVATERPSYSAEGEPLDLWLVDVAASSRRCVTRHDAIVARPVFSPDGKQVVCERQQATSLLSTAKRELLAFDVASGAMQTLTADLDVSIGDGIFGATEPLGFIDERTLLVATQHGLADDLLAIEWPATHGSAADASLQRNWRWCTNGDAAWSELSLAPASGCLLALESGPAMPEQVVLAGWPRLQPSVVDAPNAALVARPLAHSEVVAFRGSGGLELEGLLLTPPTGSAPWPTIVLLHGGSSGRATLRFNDNFAQAYAALGYAVFAPNLRGSEGYGSAIRGANEGDFGGRELDDLDLAVDALVRRGVADEKRLFLLGHSFGGFLVEMELVRSKRFAAACAAAGISDWTRFAQTSDLAGLARVGLGGGADERAELYASRSPLRQVDAITTPLLLVHGERDQRVPFSQSELLYTELFRRHADAELLRLPGVGHVFRGREVVLRWIRAADDWFRRHGAASPQGKGAASH